MKPVLFHLLSFPVSSHVIFFILGFIATFLWGFYEARRIGIDPEKMLEVGFWLFIGIVIGARIMFEIVNFSGFISDPLRIFKIWEGGMVLYGGAAGCVIAGLIAIKIKKMPLGNSADVIAQAAAIGLVPGRIGCFLAGCCYGRPSGDAICVRFTDPYSLANHMIGNQSIYPTQIFSATWFLLVFFALVFLGRRKKFPGQVAWMFFILYPIGRFIIELYRGDARGFVMEPILSKIFAPLLTNQTYTALPFGGFYHAPYLSSSQYIGVFVFLVALTGYVISRKRFEKKNLS